MNSLLLPLPRPKNPTALDLTIHRFEQLAREFHYNKARNARSNESKAKRAERERAFEKEWEHLQKEKIRISAIAKLKSDLSNYQEESKSKDFDELELEPHHPTNKLANNLRAVNEPKPSPCHDAHHIIMGQGRWQAVRMTGARLALHMHGIGINDPINGVWLPRNKADAGHWATPNSPAHKAIHRYNYETWIISNLGSATLPEHAFRGVLKGIKNKLKHGGYPNRIVDKKDASWTGEE